MRSQDNSELESKIKITNKGFQFLLQDVNAQVWAVILQYIRQNEEKAGKGKQGIHVVEILNFLFQLGCLEIGQAYLVEPLTPIQRKMLADLREFGLTYQSKDTGKFYPTRLVTVLSSIHSKAGATPLAKIGVGSPTTTSSSQQQAPEPGFIILETNYSIYAYTGKWHAAYIFNHPIFHAKYLD